MKRINQVDHLSKTHNIEHVVLPEAEFGAGQRSMYVLW